jgi:hypothetical protein
MARSRRSVAFALGALVLGASAGARLRAAPRTAGIAVGKPIVAGATVETDGDVRRRLEIEDLERQDAARELHQRGVQVNWRDVPLRVLLDWCDRIDAARALVAQLGVDVDWRKHTLAQLWDIRLRATKTLELSSAFGVAVDWRRYSWSDLEAMRRTLVRLGRPRLPEDALVPLGTPRVDGRVAWPQDPDSLLRPTFSGRAARRISLRGPDPDGVLPPLFGSPPAPIATAHRDPDGLLVPSFIPVRSGGRGRTGHPDAVLGPAGL